MYQASNPAEGRRIAEQVIGSFPTCPIPEVARLGRTLRQWRSHVLARFDTHHISNGGTEAVNLIIEKTRRLGPRLQNLRPLPAPNPARRLRGLGDTDARTMLNSEEIPNGLSRVAGGVVQAGVIDEAGVLGSSR